MNSRPFLLLHNITDKFGSSRQLVTSLGWTLSAKILTFPLSFIKVILITRLLGVEQYGLYMSVVAFVAFASPYAGWGFNFILGRKVARDKSSFAIWWGNGLFAIAILMPPVLLVTSLLGVRFLADASLLLIACLGLSELLGNRVIELAERAFRSTWRMELAALAAVLPSVTSLLILLPFALSGSHNAETLAQWTLVGSALTTVALVLLASKTLGTPQPNISLMRENLPDATYFAFGISAGTIYTNADRVLLGRLATLDAAGVYIAAMSIIRMTCLPITALSQAMMPRYFELGGKDAGAAIRFGWKNVFFGLLYALPLSLALLLGAPLMPHLLGEQFSASIEAVRWLSLFPIAFAFSDAAGMTISAIDYPKDRTIIFFVMAVVNVALNVWLIPSYTWKGAAWSVVITESLLSLCLWGATLYRLRQIDRNKQRVST